MDRESRHLRNLARLNYSDELEAPELQLRARTSAHEMLSHQTWLIRLKPSNRQSI